MARFNFFKIATVIVMVATIFSCSKDLERGEYTANHMVGAEVKRDNPDSLIGYTYRDKRERFVEGGVEYSFTHVDVYRDKGEQPSHERTSYVVALTHGGVEPQYFHFSDVLFTTTRGNENTLESLPSESGYWQVLENRKQQFFEAKNTSENSFEHSTTTGASAVTYTLPDNGELKGYVVEFDAPTWTLAEKQLENEDVTGVAYDGKTWDAVKYECEVPATFTIAENYRIAGEKPSIEVPASNLAFFLKHIIDTRLEGLKYVEEFFAEDREVKTKVEEVSGALVTYDNDEKQTSVPFNLPMNLFYRLPETGVVWVDSAEELYDESVKVVLGEVSETVETSGVFSGKSYTGSDTVILSDRELAGSFGYDCWRWGSIEFPFAMITEESRKAITVKAERNTDESTADVDVVDVKISSTPVISYVAVDIADKPMEVVTIGKRKYRIPDDFDKTYKQVDYVLNVENENAAKLIAKDNTNIVRIVNTNHGVPIDSSNVSYFMALSDEMAVVQDTLVTKDLDATLASLKVTSVENHANKQSWSDKDGDGFAELQTIDGQTIRFSSGHVIERSFMYGKLHQNGKEVYDHAEVKDAAAGSFTFGKPEIDSVVTKSSTVRVAKVYVTLLPVITSTAAVSTKAGEANVNDKTIAVTLYIKEVQNDEYIEGGDDVEEFIEPNGRGGIDAGIRLYENFTMSGRHYIGEDRVSFAYDIVGRNEDDAIVNAVSNMSQNGNGHNGTGSGTYTNNISCNGVNYPQHFNWNADGAKTATVKGVAGKGAKRTFTPSFKIADTGLTSGTQSTSGDYYVYPYASNAKGTLTVGTVSVSKDAQSTRNFLVKTPDVLMSERTTIDYKQNGQSVDYTAYLYETSRDKGEYLKDSKSGNVPFTFVGGSEADVVVNSVSNMSQSGNGRTGSGKGTYTNYINDGSNQYAQNFTFDAPASFDVVLQGTNGPETVNIPVSFVITNTGLTSGTQSVSGEYYVYPYASNAKGSLTVGTVTVSKNASSSRNFKVKTPDEITGKRTDVEYKANGESVDYTAYLYETSRDKGEYLKDSKSGNVPFTFVGGNESDVVVSSVSNMSQSGNGRTGSGKGTYTNYIMNGSNKYAQNFTFDAPASFDVVLQGTNGTETVNIPVSFKITDTGLTAGTQSTSGEYYVYPYASNAKGTLTVGTVSVSKDAQSTRNFKVMREVPKIIPEDWGKIIGAGMSAVPTHLLNEQNGFVNGNVVDGDNAQKAASCITIVTDKGAVPVIFGWADSEPVVPTTAQILGSTFTKGTYDSSYNSGYYNGSSWVPAIARDASNGIHYDIPGIPSMRFIRNESLKMWGWRSGNYSTVLSGYRCSVSDGTLTVTYNGSIVLEIR